MSQMVIKLARLFIPPIGIVLSTIFFSEKVYSFYESFSFFGIAFFLNWVADTFIIERFIGYKGNKIEK